MLLVAAPELLDPNFRRTVVYLVASGSDGAVGVVLNRPSETAVANVLPQWVRATARPQIVYSGGPVQTTSAMCLGVRRPDRPPRRVPGTVAVSGSVVLVDLDGDVDTVADELSGVRVFAGRAGWAADQLADEIAEGAWLVVPGQATDVLVGPMTDLWFTVLRRQPKPTSLLAYHPGDLLRN
jgi:putative transcriptional regulator